jgi:NADH-quinone oxidoreductase subunit J
MSATDWVFLIAGLGSAGAAALAVTRRNPLHGAVCLLGTLLGLAAVFALLAAPFLAAMQVLVYAGAILVLFLFVIMLLNLRPEELGSEATPAGQGAAAAVATTVLMVLAVAILRARAGRGGFGPEPASPFGSLAGVGEPLFRVPAVIPFELISVLIVAAIAGAVVLARKRQ